MLVGRWLYENEIPKMEFIVSKSEMSGLTSSKIEGLGSDHALTCFPQKQTPQGNSRGLGDIRREHRLNMPGTNQPLPPGKGTHIHCPQMWERLRCNPAPSPPSSPSALDLNSRPAGAFDASGLSCEGVDGESAGSPNPSQIKKQPGGVRHMSHTTQGAAKRDGDGVCRLWGWFGDPPPKNTMLVHIRESVAFGGEACKLIKTPFLQRTISFLLQINWAGFAEMLLRREGRTKVSLHRDVRLFCQKKRQHPHTPTTTGMISKQILQK